MKSNGYAVVFDGHKRILEMGDPPKKEKRPITKEEFMKLWPTLDEAGRRNLMETTTPIR